MTLPISAKQQEVLRAFLEFERTRGHRPSVRELASVLSRAPSTVHQALRALQRKGLVVNEGGAHGWRVVWERGAPAETGGAPQAEPAETAPNVVRVPVRGRIAAGRPVLAVEEHDEEIVLPADRVPEGAFALRVEGDSMIEDHILDGDLVLVEPCPTVRDGEIAVALLEDGTATLKRVRRDRRRRRILLEPANAQMDPIEVDRVRIQGRAVGVLRLW